MSAQKQPGFGSRACSFSPRSLRSAKRVRPSKQARRPRSWTRPVAAFTVCSPDRAKASRGSKKTGDGELNLPPLRRTG